MNLSFFFKWFCRLKKLKVRTDLFIGHTLDLSAGYVHTKIFHLNCSTSYVMSSEFSGIFCTTLYYKPHVVQLQPMTWQDHSHGILSVIRQHTKQNTADLVFYSV